MTTLATGSSVTVTVGDGGAVSVATNGGFASITVTPTNGVAAVVQVGPTPTRRTFGPYAEGASVSIANESAGSLDYDYQPGVLPAVQGLVSKDGSTTAFTFAGAATTAIPQASNTYAGNSIGVTIELTAGTGVTALGAQVQATNDGSSWTTIGVLTLAAPGTAKLPVAAQYQGLRVNVIALTGGTASAAVRNQVAVAAGAGSAVSNPGLTGVPQPAYYSVSQSGIPVASAPSGTIGATGALNLGANVLPFVFPNIWLYFPASAVYSGSVAGFYYTVMSSTALGQVYNVILGAERPYIPSSPALPSGSGAAYTGATGFGTFAIPIPGGAMGPNGSIRMEAQFIFPSGLAVGSVGFQIGSAPGSGSVLAGASITGSNQEIGIRRTLRNMGVQNAQLNAFPNGTGTLSTDLGSGNGTPVMFAVDTTSLQYLSLYTYLTDVTKAVVMTGYSIELCYGA